SAYRKEGAWMFFQVNGDTFGTISGGCLERNLEARAKELFGTGGTMLCQFDMSAEDDLGWGRGAGCNGVVTVFLRDMDRTFRDALSFLFVLLRSNRPAYFIQSIEDRTQFKIQTETGQHAGTMLDDIYFELTNDVPFAESAGLQADGAFYVQKIWPKPNLYVIGAGIDARPLAAIAAQVGYAVHILDWRAALCEKEYF